MKKTVPTPENPPFSSPLWDHVDLIRSKRRARETWKDIAVYLDTKEGLSTYGLHISYKTIHAFFKRACQRETLPLGWDEASERKTKPIDTSPQSKINEPTPPENSKKERPLYEPEPEPKRDLFPN